MFMKGLVRSERIREASGGSKGSGRVQKSLGQSWGCLDWFRRVWYVMGVWKGLGGSRRLPDGPGGSWRILECQLGSE